jgi:transposase
MMGRLNHDQGLFFYSFRLDGAVPDDHLIRQIAATLDLSWVHSELAPFYPKIGRPSIDPVLMVRMLVIGYVFALRSERALCRDVQVNLAYRWFCGLSIEDKIPDQFQKLVFGDGIRSGVEEALAQSFAMTQIMRRGLGQAGLLGIIADATGHRRSNGASVSVQDDGIVAPMQLVSAQATPANFHA